MAASYRNFDLDGLHYYERDLEENEGKRYIDQKDPRSVTLGGSLRLLIALEVFGTASSHPGRMMHRM